MFTGVYPYRELLKMALHPRLQAHLFAGFLKGCLEMRLLWQIRTKFGPGLDPV